MILKKLFTLAGILLLAAAVQAELLFVDDLEGRPIGNLIGATATAGGGGLWGVTNGTSSGNVQVQLQSESQVVNIVSNSSGDGRGASVYDLDNTIADMTKGVAFFRFYTDNSRAADMHIGIHASTGAMNSSGHRNTPQNYIIAGFRLFSDGAAAGQVNMVATKNVAEIIKGGLLRGQWYNCWIEVDHTTDTYNLYVSEEAGPAGAATLPTAEALVAQDRPFDNATTAALTGIFWCSASYASQTPPGQRSTPQTGNTRIDEVYWDGDEGLTLFTRKARNPIPASRATLVPVEQILSWEAPDDPNVVTTSGYDIYLDPNQANVTNGLAAVRRSTNQLGTSFDPALLNEVQYFWRVDSHIELDDPNHSHLIEPGKVWTFTTVPMTPVITLQPVSQVRGIKNGKPDAVFTVEAVNAASYQWRKNGNPLSNGGNVSGATTATLTLAGVTQTDEGQYSCLVSNGPSNSVLSDTVWLEYARQTGQWAFENDYVDSVGGHNGTVADANSTPAFVAGRIGSFALSLDGTSDYLSLPAAALSKAGTEMTFSFWAMNNTPTAGTVTLYGYAAALPGNRLVNIHTPWSNNTAYLDVSNSDAAGTYDRVGGGSAVDSAAPPYWIYWTFSKDQETGLMRVYRNGQQFAQATGQARLYYGADNLMLGANRNASNVLGQFFSGAIDDLRFYNYYMDEVEAAYLYSDAAGESVCVYPNDAALQAWDFNTNCRVDIGDLGQLASNWLYDQLVP